jgi:hypothetical protein
MVIPGVNVRFVNFITGMRYAGEKIPGDLDGWAHLSDDPNDFLRDNYDLLSRRSVTLYHTYPAVIGAINKQTDYAIGKGLLFRSYPNYRILGKTEEWARSWAQDLQQAVEFEFSRVNFFQKQGALFRTALMQGDSLLYFLRDGGEFDLIEMPGSVIDSNREEADETLGLYSTLGIRHDAWYRRLGFYDRSGEYVEFRHNGRQNAVQFYLKRMARQVRGWPLSYAVIALAKNDDRHTDATLAAALAESMIAIFTESDRPQDDFGQLDNLAREARGKKGVIAQALERIGNVKKMLPGSMLQMKTGGKVNVVDKKSPNATFSSFKDWMVDYIGMATGTPPEVIKSKYSTSYTAHKGALNDFERNFMANREAFIDTVCYPVLRETAINLILRGELEAPGFFESERIQRAYLDGNWRGPSLGHINPAQEINAITHAVKEKLMTKSEAAYRISSITDYEAFSTRWKYDEGLYPREGTGKNTRKESGDI